MLRVLLILLLTISVVRPGCECEGGEKLVCDGRVRLRDLERAGCDGNRVFALTFIPTKALDCEGILASKTWLRLMKSITSLTVNSRVCSCPTFCLRTGMRTFFRGKCPHSRMVRCDIKYEFKPKKFNPLFYL